jgi:hypothetical protein
MLTSLLILIQSDVNSAKQCSLHARLLTARLRLRAAVPRPTGNTRWAIMLVAARVHCWSLARLASRCNPALPWARLVLAAKSAPFNYSLHVQSMLWLVLVGCNRRQVKSRGFEQSVLSWAKFTVWSDDPALDHQRM